MRLVFWRWLALFVLAAAPLLGDPVDDKIRMLVDPESYQRHSKLLELIFKERERFYTENGPDILLIVETLKENGLLRIFHKTPRELTATFETRINPLFLIKALQDSLNDLGFNYYLTSAFEKSGERFLWRLSYKSQYAIDPVVLAGQLDRYGIRFYDISRDGDDWYYHLSAPEPELSGSEPLDSREARRLINPSGEYWVRLREEGRYLEVRTLSPGYWYPDVVFYDRYLNILKIYRKDRSTRGVRLTIPEDTRYIKVTDRFTVENLKHGIRIGLEGS